MLELHEVGYRYPGAERPALDGVSLQLQTGQCLGLLGGNGAGKTTLLSLVSGLRSPQYGEIRWQGLASDGGSRGLVPQQLAFYGRLTVQENLDLFADLHHLRGAARRERLQLAVVGASLDALRQCRAANLSGGQQRRLNFAIGMLQPAALYLFDEATVGVDAHARQRLLATVRTLCADGAAVIYTSHYLEEIDRLADRILLLDNGRVRLDVARHDLESRQPAGGEHDLLLEWPQPGVPPGLREALTALGLAISGLPAGLHIRAVTPDQLVSICTLIARQPVAPRLLRFGQPSLEQLYLQLTGGEL